MKKYKNWLFLAAFSAFAGSQEINAQTITGLSPATYSEKSPAITIQPNFTVNGGNGFGGGYLLFDLTNGSLADQLGITSDANPNAVGAISVSGSGIFLGNGTGTNIVGSIDGVLNGQNGKKLKINFTSNFSNSSFESGLNGWTIVNQQVDLGITPILGFTTPNDPTNPSNTTAGDSHIPQSVSYSTTISTTEHSDGLQSLRLFSSMTTRQGCDVVHGPYVYSAPFQSNANDVLSFDWRAIGGDDAYDVFGYILNTQTGATTVVLNQTGANASASTPWATARVTVPTTGTYQFIFISGTWDQTCGLAAGASLYIDNVKVFGDIVNPAVITSIARQVTYQNNCGTSAATRNLTVSLFKGDNTSTTASSTVALNTFAPTAISKNITVYLNAAGQVTIAENAVDNGSNDVCGVTFNTDINNFNCSNLGDNPVVLSVTDSYGNVSTSNATVTVVDNMAPVVPVLANLTGECSVTVTSAPTTTDNCKGTVTGTTNDPLSYSTQGTHIITWSFNDGNGNTSTATQKVIIKDNTAPVPNVATLPTITGECSVTVTSAPTATDNCNGLITGTTTNPLTYTAQGTYDIVWTYNDGNGKTSTQTQTVIVDDVTAPAVSASGTKIISIPAGGATNGWSPWIYNFTDPLPAGTEVTGVDLTYTAVDQGWGGTGAPSDMYISGSYIGSAQLWHTSGTNSISNTMSVPNYVYGGNNTLQMNFWGYPGWQAFWQGGTMTIHYQSVGIPTIYAECSATIATAPTAPDNCAGTITGTTTDPLTYTTPGTHTVTWAFNDGNGNISTATQNVVIKDITKPTIAAPVTVNAVTDNGMCTASNVALGNAATSDNCSSVTVTNDAPATFPLGSTTVTWTATDATGNSETSTQIVMVTDNQAPVFAAITNKAVNTDQGKCGAAVNYTTPVGTDNCSANTVQTAGLASGSIFPVGTTTNTFVATDASGNATSISFDVTVSDNEAPIALAQNLTVQLDASGNGSITEAMVNNGSTDNCGIATYALDKKSFNCSNIGANTVTLTVTDIHNNVSTATATITVKDEVAPVALAKNIAVTLVNGSATITAANVDNGSNDACGIKSMSVSPKAFNCSTLGNNTVTLTVTDNNGNVSTTQATVNVIGQLPTPSITVIPTTNVYTGGNVNNLFLGYGAQSTELKATGGVSYNWTSNTGLSNKNIANPIFTPTTAGTYTFTVNVTNQYGCMATKSVTINVVDARCGNKNDKVVICHEGHDICVDANAVPAHMAHGGDYLGSCRSNSARIAQTSSTQEAVLKAFPNPFTSTTNLEFTLAEAGKYQVELIDMKGALVKVVAQGEGVANKNYSQEIAAGNLPNGIYIIRLVSANEVKHLRIILEK